MSDEPTNVDLETPDLAAEKRAAFDQLFPGVLADGVLDAARLGELLDTEVTAPADGRERFGLMWAGKQEAVRSLLTPSRGTLVPQIDRSVDFDNARNVFIEGDNLEVLKLLQKAYNDRVKLIYIDPPYNTGGDFVYDDDFSDGLRGYLRFTGQLDNEGNRVAAAADSAGRRHSHWLSMMYPRLVLARNLLSQDGYLFVSISDIELPALRLLLDEVFGESSLVETFIWRSIFRPSNMSKRVRRNAEYVLCYRRAELDDAELVERLDDPKGEPSLTQNNNARRSLTFPSGKLHVKLPDGTYPAGAFGEIELLTPLVVENGQTSAEVQIAGRFKWSQQYLDAEIAKGVYLVVKTESFIPYYRKDYQKTALRPTKIIADDLVGDVLQANAEIARVLPPGVFDYPKPTSLIRFLLRMTGTSGDDVIMDFFAGSGTTAHAVTLQNEEDGARRRSISINLPEPTPAESPANRQGFETVADICLARIEAVLGGDGHGLRAFRLEESSFGEPESGGDSTIRLVESTIRRPGVPDETFAAEILLKEGVPLDAPWSRSEVGGVPVVEAAGVAVVLSTKTLTEATVDRALDRGATVLVFLEDGFAGADVLKANAVTKAKNLGITLKTI